MSMMRHSHLQMPQQHFLSRNQVIWSFGPGLQPVLEVEPGDVVTFETNDCFTGQITSEADLVTDIDLTRINSATGPVAVKGAEPGDSLVAEILDIRPIEWGVATLIPGFGQLIEQVQAPLTRLFEVKDGMIRQNERISFPARPMVGVVGVATGGEELSTGLAGQHGGNLDDHLHGKGATIFFPVRQPGGMFAVGDMHASMGDGEICFTGVEIAGEVDIRFDLLKGKQATWPVTELADRWLPHATADRFDDALKLVSEEAARMLVDEHGFSMEDAFIFLSVACDAGVAQACKPAEGFGTIARFSIPKIDACPAPFHAA
jgi:amidase